MMNATEASDVGAARPTARGWARLTGGNWEEVRFSVDDLIFEIVRPGRGSTWIPASEVRGVDEVAGTIDLTDDGATAETAGGSDATTGTTPGWIEIEVRLRDGEPIGARLDEPTLTVLLDILRSTAPPETASGNEAPAPPDPRTTAPPGTAAVPAHPDAVAPRSGPPPLLVAGAALVAVVVAVLIALAVT